MIRVNCSNTKESKRCGRQFRVRLLGIKYCRACYKALNGEVRPLNRTPRKARVAKPKFESAPINTKTKKKR